MHVSRLDLARKRSANGGVAQFLFRQLFAGFARNQQGLQAIDFLQCQIVGRLRALVAARHFVELLLRDQVVLEHFLGAAVLAIRIEQICLCALHRSHFSRIRGRRLVGSNAKLGANLAHQSLLTIHFELQFALVEQDQRLPLPYRVAHVHEHFGDDAFHLGAQRAFFECKQ